MPTSPPSPTSSPPMSPPMSPPRATVTSRSIRLVAVHGLLDARGRQGLRHHLAALLADGIVELVVDLSQVSGCDPELFPLLADTRTAARTRGGWLRLVGLSPPVLDALDEADLPDVALVYRISGWTRAADPRAPAARG